MSEAVGAIPSLETAQRLIPLLVQAAQAEYDEWDESNEDEYAGGGICDRIADAFVRLFDEHGIESALVSSPHEQHVFVALQLDEGVYTLDLPYSVYEVGAAFTWSKIHGVKFSSGHLVWHQVSSDSTVYKAYITE